MSEQIYQLLLEGEIRTLSVTASSNGVLECFLTVEKLSEADFVAVSYVWGDGTSKRRIQLNGEPWEVTANAYHILSESQRRPELVPHRRIWMDALCIDQRDGEQSTHERSSQINMMQDIYSAAAHTLLWIGAPAKQGDARILFSWFRELLAFGSFERYKMYPHLAARFWSNTHWMMFKELLSQPWHWRRWIVQEVVRSKSPHVLYGDQLMPWTDFSDAILRFSLLHSDKRELAGFAIDNEVHTINMTPLLTMIWLCRRRDSGNTTTPLLYLLHHLRWNDCGIDRDRVFALLGLCSEQEREKNYPDTSLGLREVYVRFVLAYVELYNLDVLCLATPGRRLQRPESIDLQGNVMWSDTASASALPSWCPDLASPETWWMFGQYLQDGDDEPHTYFRASADVPSNVQHNDGVLSVSGLLVDEIVAYEYNAQKPGRDEAGSIVYELCFKLARRYCKIDSDLDLITSFFRTITAGGRRACTRDYVSDAYLRFNLSRFFRETPLGRTFRDLGCDEQLPARSDWYMDAHAHERYDERPPAIERRYLDNATFACTKGGRMALVPRHTSIGDQICVLFGCSSPMVLRKCQEVDSEADRGGGEYFYKIGEAYLDGYIHGEAIADWRDGRLQEQVFHIK